MYNQLENSPQYWAVIPAAGIGQRFKSDRPKQYLNLAGKPVIVHTLVQLLVHPKITNIVVVIHEQDQYWESVKSQLPFSEKLIMARGGSTRHYSVLNGLHTLATLANENDWIIVHDAARPLLTQVDIDKLINYLQHHPVGGLLGTRVRDTLKRTDNLGNVLSTLERDNTWQALTPQMFRFHKLLKALELAKQQQLSITDEAAAIELLGETPQMVEGQADNIKITYPDDLSVAEKLLKNQQEFPIKSASATPSKDLSLDDTSKGIRV